uniref:Centromere protein J C-terminal domain-containing protein n=1 Tax=Anopheles farauti TaxID=69004 RepID=A0A182Q4X0_9DIPT
MADSPRSILARLAQLKQWQEEQQRVLLQKHLAQQQLLEREQQKMYQVYRLQTTESTVEEETYEDSGSEPEYEETNLEAQLAAERLQRAPVNEDSTMFDSDTEQPTVEQQEALQKTKNIPKKRFLKRGEGLRARFKVDPDKFKLANLPKYKFANHNSERNKRKSGTIKQEQIKDDGGGGGGGSMTVAGQKAIRVPASKPELLKDPKKKVTEKKARNKSDQGIVLDVNRVQSKKLKCTRRAGGSLPTGSSLDQVDTVGHDQLFTDIAKIVTIANTGNKPNEPSVMPDVPWNQQLDPTIASKLTRDQRDLNFFELLEAKVGGRSFNSNSSSILRFIAANESTANEETLTNDDTQCAQLESEPLVRQEEVVLKERLTPAPPQAVLTVHDTDDSDEDGDVQEGQVHVHFADERSCEEGDDSDATHQETYNHLRGMSSSKMSTPNDKLFPHAQSLENAGELESDEEQSTGCSDDNATIDSVNGQPEGDNTPVVVAPCEDDMLRNEILAKRELLQERLTELEREIENYRRENAELIQAKQDHELERLKLQQEREEQEERMNDERIKMEVYFHDERMKIETERKQALREAQKPNKKDREEIMRLNEELTELRKQQKEREAKHNASLARFRAQLKTVEKDLQEVRLELEVTKKDNRRLETENTRLKRQNNSRMLVEINRNIAKLAAGGASEAQRDDSKDSKGHSPEKQKKAGQQITNARSKASQQKTMPAKERKVQVMRAKVTSHQPTMGGKLLTMPFRKKSLPVQEECATTTDTDNENNENGAFSGNDTSDEENSFPRAAANQHEPDDDDDEEDVLGEYSSSAREEPVGSSYFPQNAKTVRKTLFTAESGPLPRQGLVRKETAPEAHDRTPEAAERIKSLKREIVNADGSRDIWYPNGNLKKISPDGLTIRMLYFNKDIKETNMSEGTTKYYYFETNTWHTTYLDGLEILEFPDGQTEHRFKDGSTEVHFPNGSIRTTNPNSADIAEEWKYPDGTTVIIRKNDDKEINLPNGQVEIHTKAHKRRIYPDGTVKFVYPDGSQESRYSNGRVRLKDKDGRLLSDTGGPQGK